jgi:XTP/dITP diphosphohydrolase
VKLLLATTSQGKLREQRQALSGLDLTIVGLSEVPPLEAPEEKGSTFRENAEIKALYYHRATGLPALGEDAGLVVDALGGKPGVESARWLGESTGYRQKNSHLLELLSNVPEAERTARYVSALALAAGGEIVFEHEATCEGLIAREPRGDDGFGYDPVFLVPPIGKTMAELTREEKNAISHRGKAVSALRDYLVRSGVPTR